MQPSGLYCNFYGSGARVKPCWAQYLLWFVIAVLGTGAMLSGCGQKGDLYLPDQPPKKQQRSSPG